MRGVLAIDHGERVFGFAVTDPLRLSRNLLAPLRPRGGEAEAIGHIRRLIDERDVDTVLLGLPLAEDGADTGRSRAVRAFAGRLALELPRVRILGWDERLTTRAAQDLLLEQGLPKKRREELRDSAAALVLLSDWIESGEPATHPLAG